MSQDERIEIGNYLFDFRQPKDDFQNCERIVICKVQWYGGSIKEEQKNEILQILEQMGQWEHLISLMDDLGFHGPTRPSYDFGRDLYDIVAQVDNSGYLGVSFTAYPLVALKRTKGQDDRVKLEKSEIERQIANIPKWQHLKAVTKDLVRDPSLV